MRNGDEDRSYNRRKNGFRSSEGDSPIFAGAKIGTVPQSFSGLKPDVLFLAQQFRDPLFDNLLAGFVTTLNGVAQAL